MHTFRVKAFGITKDILGGKEMVIEATGVTVADLRSALNEKYPKLTGLRSLFIAVNNSYADETAVIGEGDEIALIPPVSGG
jgi:molybdopterin synthase sulfur carrier subunit